jgi:DNA repair photolyase
MGLNRQSGNMYPWVDATWNPVRGCLHQCSYCYLKSLRGYDTKPRLVEKELTVNLGKGKVIFVGSTSDMWGSWVPGPWIVRVLDHCKRFADNRYLFQSKNPIRFLEFLFPEKAILGTTIETNRDYQVKTEAPVVAKRALAMKSLPSSIEKKVSIEPIVDFDLDKMVSLVRMIGPQFVSIGADSKGHKLCEPSWSKVEALVSALRKMTVVRLKGNLDRLRS